MGWASIVNPPPGLTAGPLNLSSPVVYLRGLWDDTRRSVLAGPDLLLAAAVFALAALVPQYVRPRYANLAPGWPSAVTVIWRSLFYLALPLLALIPLRLPPTKAGFSLARPGRWLRDIGLLYLLMLPLVYFASRQTGFQRAYPFFSFERLGAGSLLLGLGIRALGMFAWEFICRGFLLFAFERRVGSAAAIAVQTIPFAVMHAGKPGPEAIGAIVAGIALGIIALRNRSFIPGAILHWAVAATLDLFAIANA